MPCPLPIAKRVVMEDDYKRIVERGLLAPGEKSKLPGWIVRLAHVMISGESNVRWVLHINVNLLRYARLLDDGPDFTVKSTKKRCHFYYKLIDVIEWCAAKRIRVTPDSEAPYYFKRKYQL